MRKSVPPPGGAAGGDIAAPMPPLAPLPLIELWMDLGSEMLDFAAERVREEVRVQHQILHCRSPAELISLQLAFLQRALDDYNAQAGRLATMTRRMGPILGEWP